MCGNDRENVENLSGTSHHSIPTSYLNPADFSLPTYDDGSETNPKFHLQQLEEYMRIRNVPKAFQLTIAYKSITGMAGRQWIQTVANNLTDYESFKQAFLNNWWSASRQALARCNLYQEKYNRQSNLSLSGHFLKYATLASYLEPRPSDIEIIEAIRQHFPITVQRAMLGNQLNTVQETLNLLKRVEIMEGSEASHRPNSSPFQQNPHEDRRNTNHQNNDRYWENRNVRNIHYDRNYQRNYEHRNNGRQAYYQDWSRRNDSPPRQRIETLNPNAPTFRNDRDREETEDVRRNISDQENRG
jgi:hypothetical protein